MRTPLILSPLAEYAVDATARGHTHVSNIGQLAQYVRDVMGHNQATRNFRIVCPDELESNRLGAVLDITDWQYVWPLPAGTEHTSRDGRVLEVPQ